MGVKRSPRKTRAAAERKKTQQKRRQERMAAKDNLFTGAFASRRDPGLKYAASALKWKYN